MSDFDPTYIAISVLASLAASLLVVGWALSSFNDHAERLDHLEAVVEDCAALHLAVPPGHGSR